MFFNRKTQKRYCKLILISIFSFILGSMVAINLAPINKTCRIENQDKEYNIMNNSKLKNPDLMIIIVTARHITNVKHYFVIGTLGLSNSVLANLKTEQKEHNDLLYLPIYDSYQNLTEKIAKTFSWLTDQLDVGLNFKYVLKCDDDSFVRLENLVHELNHLEIIYVKSHINNTSTVNDNTSPYITANYQVNNAGLKNPRSLYWGYFSGHARIYKKGKWKETEWILCDYYIPYALGGGYVLSKNLVTYLGRNADYLRYYNSEDISVGTWLGPINNLIRIHDIRFDTEWISRGCQNHYLISHHLSIPKMHELFKNIMDLGNMCATELVDHPHYLYNWLLPPTKCCPKNK
ncbi:hypothetical protein AMK59_7275 [Oryctes borbonicus]|uniref:Hexosyltransferase n=1 Tax=Oryctes borbonicus TaxID=1629725 RepID=A0A0T6AWB4_9SCAR|nr:hypothetical protein AMK59_7275 [Oryctes borbonicus]